MKIKLILAGVLAAAAAGGCVRREVVYVQGPPPPGTVVYESEPAPIVEVVPEAPTVGVIWVPGFWFYDHHHWEWRHGHWRR